MLTRNRGITILKRLKAFLAQMIERDTKLSIGIIGSGAIGLFVGSKLLDAGHKVYFVARSNYRLLADHGFKVTEPPETTTEYTAVNVYNKLTELPPVDIIFLCTTVADNASYLSEIKNISKPNTLVISLQNGINFEEETYQQVAPLTLLSGTCWIKITKLEKNHIRHDFGVRIILGTYPSITINPLSPTIKQFNSTMQQAGFELELVDNYLSAQLTKLTINLPFFGLMLKYDIKQAMVAKQYHSELVVLQQEMQNIAQQLKAEVDFGYVLQMNAQLAKLPEEKLHADEKIRLQKEISPSFENFFLFLKQHGLDEHTPQLITLYNSITVT